MKTALNILELLWNVVPASTVAIFSDALLLVITIMIVQTGLYCFKLWFKTKMLILIQKQNETSVTSIKTNGLEADFKVKSFTKKKKKTKLRRLS